MHCKSYSHFFSKKFQHICVSLNVNFNESLTNDVVSFEQLGPENCLDPSGIQTHDIPFKSRVRQPLGHPNQEPVVDFKCIYKQYQIMISHPLSFGFVQVVLRFYGPVNPMGSCRARSVYLTTRLLGRLSPPSG